MRPFVISQALRFDERLVANTALVRSLSGVGAHMPLEAGLLVEGTVTVAAHVGPFAGVDEDVPLQVLRLDEGLLTELAHKAPVTGMHTLVPAEFCGRGVRLTANLTLERCLPPYLTAQVPAMRWHGEVTGDEVRGFL